MNAFIRAVEQAKHIAVTGHIRPDGDCVGACLGVYNYIQDNYPDKSVDVYLEPIQKEFHFLNGCSYVKNQLEEEIKYDLCIILDCSEASRIQPFLPLYENAGETICIDHHISNHGFCDNDIVDPGASATCQLLYLLMEDELITLACAECLYTGIVHDTGVFKHSNTMKETMCIAGELIEKGVNTSHIIDDTFYRKTYAQNQILGYALLESALILDEKVIYSFVTKKWQDLYGVTSADMGGIIDQLRITEGVEVAIFGYELQPCEFKISMRSNDYVDVSKIAAIFGGGGHIKAAGCTMNGTSRDIINNLLPYIEKQLKVESDC